MIKTITSYQAKSFDQKAKEEYGISTLVLMENAGRSVAEEVLKLKKRKIAIFCGKGNNGGDGFVCARHLLTEGIRPDIFLAGKIKDVKDEAKINLEILLKLKQKITELNRENLYLLKNKISKYNLIVDAIFGVGLKGKIEGFLKDLIEMINSSGVFILSVDIPSGLDANTGEILGSCIKADKTLTFVAKKQGMIFPKAKRFCGKIIVKELGIRLPI